MSNVLDRITMLQLPPDQFVQEEAPKRQIYVHHTASGPNPYGVLDYWKATPDKIATAFIIGGAVSKGAKWKDGDIVQCFGSGKWAWHLGLKAEHLAKGGEKKSNNVDMNKFSIGIEICNWGQLTKTDKGYKSYAGVLVPDDQVVEYTTPYKGFTHYQKYTDAQIEVTHDLLVYLGQKWNIPTAYKGDRIFDICPEALCGEPGIWTHTSVRPDKFDCHPQPELIAMLKTL